MSVASSLIIPVKSLVEPKKRLSPILDLEERRKLAIVMFQDVLETALESNLSENVLVICDDERIQGVSKGSGSQILREKKGRGLNAAISQGIDYLEKQGFDSLVIVPADTPLIEKSDIDIVYETSRSFNVVICPCKRGEGTNALALRPPDVISPQYGGGSFHRHVRAARDRGATYRILMRSNIALDVDYPGDLVEVTRRGTVSRTARYLEKIRFQQRFTEYLENAQGTSTKTS